MAVPLPVTFTVSPAPPSSVVAGWLLTVPLRVVAEPVNVSAVTGPPTRPPRILLAISAVLILFSVVVAPETITGAVAVCTSTVLLLTVTR